MYIFMYIKYAYVNLFKSIFSAMLVCKVKSNPKKIWLNIILRTRRNATYDHHLKFEFKILKN